MKTYIITLLLALPFYIFSQPWSTVTKEKTDKMQPDFELIQKSFYDYNKQFKIEDGKRELKGKLIKVPNWKLYKRWEWFWEPRLNKTDKTLIKLKSSDKYYSQKSQNAKSKAEGNWSSLGPSHSDGKYAGIGRINCVAFHPTNNDVFWVGSPSGGLWVTNDDGNNWSVLTDNNAVLGVSDIAVTSDYATSGTIFIATGDRDGGSIWSLKGDYSKDNNSIGVLKSTNNGASWQTTGLTYKVSDNKQVGRLMLHPTNNNIIYAGTSDGISKTTNGGADWVEVYSGAYVIDMEFKPGNPDIIYASTKDYWGKPAILKSTNTGTSWSILKEFVDTVDYRIELAVTANDQEYVYAIVANLDGGLSGIYRSINSGLSFSKLIDGDQTGNAFLGYYGDGSGENDGQGGYDLCIAASPSDKNMLFFGGINTWKSTTGGTVWEVCNMWTSGSDYNTAGAPVVHADKHALAFRSNGDLFEANDGGIYKSSDNGSSWTDLTNNMVISQMYRLSNSQTNAEMVLTGLQDNGSKLFEANNWTDVTGGDGMECIIDYTDEEIQYASYLNGELYRTNDKWNLSKVTISDNITDDNGAWVTPYVIDQNNHNTIYVGYSDIWKSSDMGNSFAKISDVNTSEKIRSLAVAASNSDVIYAADFGHIWKTENGGSNWTEITSGLPVATNYITYIAIHDNDPQTIWVSMSAYNGKGVYESTDGGTTWTDISSGLPLLPVMCVVQNKQVKAINQLYAATDVGIYVKNGTDDWINFSEGLPNVLVTELDIYYSSNTSESKIRAATYGRGLWESSLYGSLPIADFSASDTNVVQTDTVYYSDSSINSPNTWEWSFYGGKPQTSTEQNPKVVYDTAGVFDVKLVAANNFGLDTIIKNTYITVNELKIPIAGFKAANSTFYINEAITFTDTSLNNPTSWQWYFPGGTPSTSTARNPIVSYNTEGIYNVSLKVANSVGEDSIGKIEYINIVVAAAPVAGFKANSTSIFAGGMINFIDTSKNIPNDWNWTFEGGTPSVSQVQNPTIIYETAGNYAVSLVVANQTGKDSTGIDSYIEVKDILQAEAAFTADSTSGNIPFTVNFTNNSVNANSYSWDFGDGTTSNETDPSHEYKFTGTYSVSLIASNENNSNTLVKTNYITANPAVAMADFIASPQSGVVPLEVTFINNSENADTYLWDFGDGNISTETSVVHVYEQTGDYSVKLTASNSTSTDSKSKANYIEVNYPDPVASFEANPLSGIAPLMVSFTDLSENAQNWRWDFGDDSDPSNDQHPTHEYGQGSFNVSLLVTNPSGHDMVVMENYINVNPNALPDNLKEKLKVFPNPVENVLTVDFENENNNQVEIKLFDSAAKLLTSTTNDNSVQIHEQIDMTNYDSGTYLLSINIETNIVVLSIIKK